MGNGALLIGSATAMAGIAALRFAWSRSRRSLVWTGGGWGLLAFGALAGAIGAGAWGMAVAALFGMGTALLLLTHAAVTSPVAAGAKASNRRAGMLPQGGEPRYVWRRVVTFFMVVFGAMIVAAGLAIAVRCLLAWAGVGEADANVSALFAMPLACTGLAYALLMETRRARQWRLLAMAAAPGLVSIIVAGFSA